MESLFCVQSVERLLVPIVRQIAARIQVHTCVLTIVAIGTDRQPRLVVGYIPKDPRALERISLGIDDMVAVGILARNPYRGVTVLKSVHRASGVSVTFYPAHTDDEIETFIKTMGDYAEASVVRLALN